MNDIYIFNFSFFQLKLLLFSHKSIQKRKHKYISKYCYFYFLILFMQIYQIVIEFIYFNFFANFCVISQILNQKIGL